MNPCYPARILALPVCALVAHAGPVSISWTNPLGGYWGVDSNWGTFASPTLSDHAIISLPGSYIVTVGADEHAASLQLSNPTATLGIGNARSLSLHGDVLNEGLILINSESFASQSILRFESGASIGGSGTLRLNAPGLRSQLLGPPAGEMLVHGAGHTIEGSGTINAELINDATIRANVPGEELTLLASAMTNNAMIEAVGSSVIALGAQSLTQTPGAILQARGTGSRVELNGTALIGGELFADPGAFLEARNASMGANVLSAGVIAVRDDDSLTITDTIRNEGRISLNPSGEGAANLHFSLSSLLLGSGTIELGSPESLISADPGVSVTNTTGHTITGLGTIGAELVNEGTLLAQNLGEELRFLGTSVINKTALEAIAGSTLRFEDTAVTNTDAVLLADGEGSRIVLEDSSVARGEIHALNGALVEIHDATLNTVDVHGHMSVGPDRVLTIRNTITNHGTITLNGDDGAGTPEIHFRDEGGFLGNGSVRMNARSSLSRITSDDTEVLVAEGHTISGSGWLSARIRNRGLIVADEPGQRFVFADPYYYNHSTIRAENESRLNFQFTWINNEEGELVADGPGSTITLNNVEVRGGSIHALNGAVIHCNGSELRNNDLRGDFHITSQSTDLIGTITNHGSIVVNPQTSSIVTSINIAGDVTLDGAGSLRLNAPDLGARITTPGFRVLTNSAEHTILGYGKIEATLYNYGLVLADIPETELELLNETKVNYATIRAENGARIRFDTTNLLNQGDAAEVVADGPGSTIVFNGGRFDHGRIIGRNGGEFIFTSGALEHVDIDAPVSIPQGIRVFMQTPASNHGTIVVNSDGDGATTELYWRRNEELSGEGTIRLNALGQGSRIITTSNGTVTLGAGQRLEGIGSLDAPLRHRGTTAPGLGIGVLLSSRSIIYEPTSIFEAEIGPEANDRLECTSSVTLDGTLRVVLSNGFVPDSYWARTIIIASTITNGFIALDAPAPPDGLITRVYNTGTELIVGQTCLSDFNLDGVLNFFDVSEFLTRFGNAEPEADLNGDGMLNFFDVSAFLINYSDGCEPHR